MGDLSGKEEENSGWIEYTDDNLTFVLVIIKLSACPLHMVSLDMYTS